MDDIEVEMTAHWGCQLPGGVIRWDPSYGTGIHIPYEEADARADVSRNPGSTLLTRTEEITTITTPWVEV